MKNIQFFKEIETACKVALCAACFTTAIFPISAYASEDLSVEYKYTGNLVEMIDPTNWDYDYNTAVIRTANTNVLINSDTLEELVNTNDDVITFNDGGSIITYNKEDLKNEMIMAKESYSPNGEKAKKIILNGGVTLAFLGATGLCIYNERKKH